VCVVDEDFPVNRSSTGPACSTEYPHPSECRLRRRKQCRVNCPSWLYCTVLFLRRLLAVIAFPQRSKLCVVVGVSKPHRVKIGSLASGHYGYASADSTLGLQAAFATQTALLDTGLGQSRSLATGSGSSQFADAYYDTELSTAGEMRSPSGCRRRNHTVQIQPAWQLTLTLLPTAKSLTLARVWILVSSRRAPVTTTITGNLIETHDG